MPQELAGAPADIHAAKTAIAQELRPVFRLAMLEPLNVRRHWIAQPEIAKKVMPRRIDNNELAAGLHHAGDIAEDLAIFVLRRL